MLIFFRSQSYQLPKSATPWQFFEETSISKDEELNSQIRSFTSIPNEGCEVSKSTLSPSKKTTIKPSSKNVSPYTDASSFDDEEFDEVIRKSLL